uniref:CHAT domain-containing tetratricopeptide repeat protein n=1 Tax=Marinobacterium profundum TaxID=1714300 RepID=UPI00083352F9
KDYLSGDYAQARSRWEQGLALATQQGRDTLAAVLLINLARLDESVGQYALALSRAGDAVQIAQSLNDPKLDAQARSIIALIYRRTDDYAAAREYADQALTVARQIGDAGLASENLRNLGAIHQSEGAYDDAMIRYQEALKLARSSNDKAREAEALNNIGGLFRLQGRYQTALSAYNSALALEKSRQNRPGQVKLLGNLCLIQQNLNALEQALDDCERSLRMAQKMGDQVREANNYNNIGAIYRARGLPDKALEHYQRSLAIKRQIRDQAGVARTLNNLGELYLGLGNVDAALIHFSESLHIQEAIGDRAGFSAAHYNLGLLYHRRGEYDLALDHYKKALVIQLEVGERNLLWRIYNDISRLYASMASPRVGIFFGKLAVNTLQTIRGGIQTLDKTTQRIYLADKLHVYKRLAGLLIDEGRLPEAQRVLDMLKQEEYADFVVRSATANSDDTQSDFAVPETPLADQLQAFKVDLLSRARDYEALQAKKRRLYLQGKTLSNEEQIALSQHKQDIERAEHALSTLLAQLESELQSAPQISEVDANTLEYLFNLQGAVSDVSERTGIRAVMLHYLVTTDYLYIILTTATVQVARQIPVSATQLHRQIQDLRAALLSPSSKIRQPAAALYSLLIAPIANDLEQAEAELLWVSMDGALRYVPLSALYDSQSSRWLTQDYAVAMLTEATQNSWKDQPSAKWKVAGLGLSRKVEGFARLTAVADELDGIVRQENSEDPDGVLPGIIHLDDAFTAASLEELLDLQLFPVIHIASHFVLPAGGNYKEAFLVLGNGDRLNLDRFQRLRFDKVELLTLSACNTAVGEQARGPSPQTSAGLDAASGREVEGLGSLVQRRGASSVLATLWEVADVATGTFMQRFYRLRTEGRSKAEALRAAQLSFIGRDPGTDLAPNGAERGAGLAVANGDSPGYSHPYFWAPFILMGNWQ